MILYSFAFMLLLLYSIYKYRYNIEICKYIVV